MTEANNCLQSCAPPLFPDAALVAKMTEELIKQVQNCWAEHITAVLRTCSPSCLVSPVSGWWAPAESKAGGASLQWFPSRHLISTPVNWTSSCWSDLLPIPCLLSVNSPHGFGAGYLPHQSWSVSFQENTSCMFQLVLESSFQHVQLLSPSVQLIPLISSLNFSTFALFQMNIFAVWLQTVLEIQP